MGLGFRMKDDSNQTLERQRLLEMLDHSLRSPMNAILHHSELVLMGIEGEISEAVRADVQTIADEAQALNAVLQRLSMWVQLEASGLSRERINITRLIRTALGTAQSEVDRAGKRFISNIADQDIQVLANEQALYQIVTRLLVDLIETGESPRINVTLRAENSSVSLSIGSDGVSTTDSSKARLGDQMVADLLLSSILIEQMGGQLITSGTSGSNQVIRLLFPRLMETVDSIP